MINRIKKFIKSNIDQVKTEDKTTTSVAYINAYAHILGFIEQLEKEEL